MRIPFFFKKKNDNVCVRKDTETERVFELYDSLYSVTEGKVLSVCSQILDACGFEHDSGRMKIIYSPPVVYHINPVRPFVIVHDGAGFEDTAFKLFFCSKGSDGKWLSVTCEMWKFLEGENLALDYMITRKHVRVGTEHVISVVDAGVERKTVPNLF